MKVLLHQAATWEYSRGDVAPIPLCGTGIMDATPLCGVGATANHPPSSAKKTPAAAAEPMTPATLGPMAGIRGLTFPSVESDTNC